MPRAIIIAGPNGAGKTTFANEYLPRDERLVQFVNADLIAAGISPYAPETADIAAGRTLIRRLDELVALRSDFALETTLSGRWLLAKFPVWKRAGYVTGLYYLRLDEPEQSIERIAERVREGGHNIPADAARRRFERSLGLLPIYQAAVDEWIVYNNSGSQPIEVARGKSQKK